MQALAITLPQLLWVVDLLCRLVAGVHVTGVTSYMLDPQISVFLRGLSLFHGWLPLFLLWLLSRLGYDARALPLQWPPSGSCSCPICSLPARRPVPITRPGRSTSTTCTASMTGTPRR